MNTLLKSFKKKYIYLTQPEQLSQKNYESYGLSTGYSSSGYICLVISSAFLSIFIYPPSFNNNSTSRVNLIGSAAGLDLK